ncbi:MAG: hypothetical protein II280_01690, partial [Lachnospiraceae bacterium]|nr:hypothetical protein [Lachnospiraceae bacterium]
MSRITEALEIAGFPEDAKAYFEEIYLTIEANEELHRHLLTSEACYYENGDYAAEIKQLAEKSGFH